MRELILHIGNHKTGTTAIQEWIAANRAGLARQDMADLHGPDGPHVHSWLTYVDHAAIFPKGYRVFDPKGFARDLAALPARRVIASSENFAFFFQEKPIAELARAVKAHFDRVRIICYIRRQDRHAVSHHTEGSRPDRGPEWAIWGQALTALPEPNAIQPFYLDYDRRLALWERAFGREALVVRPYETPRLIGGNVVADFIDAAGIDGSLCTPPFRRNRSMDRVKSRIGHILNQMTDDIALATKVTLTTINTLEAARPSKEAARAFLAPYLASNRALNARMGLTAEPDLFDMSFDDLPDQPQATWTDAEFNRAVFILADVLVKVTQPDPEAWFKTPPPEVVPELFRGAPQPAPPPAPPPPAPPTSAPPTSAPAPKPAEPGLPIEDLMTAAQMMARSRPYRAQRFLREVLRQDGKHKAALALRKEIADGLADGSIKPRAKG